MQVFVKLLGLARVDNHNLHIIGLSAVQVLWSIIFA